MFFKTKKGATILWMLGAALGMFLVANRQTSGASLRPLMKHAGIRVLAVSAVLSERQAVLDALDKLKTTLYHSYMTQTGIEKGHTMSTEVIFAGDTRYLL